MSGYFDERVIESCLITKDKLEEFKSNGVMHAFESENLILTAFYLNGEILVDSVKELN